jgi:pSer/pThr/pTyr-binding forkhead associated (FHA) protein
VTLSCWLEGLDGSRLRVGPDGLLLGGGVDCAFRTLDTRVSPRHAEINCRDQGVFLTPRGVIPTVLNGRLIHNPRQLTDGDWISLAPGVLFRATITSSPPTRWTVSDGEVHHVLGPDTPPLSPAPDTALQVTSDGALQVTFQTRLTLNGVTLEPDRRPWALESGDVLTLPDGIRLTVTATRRDVPPPRVWAMRGPLRYHPPLTAHLTARSRLRLRYPDTTIEIEVRDGALLSTILAADGAVSADPAALLRLQEDLIGGGVDGFCLLSLTADGVHLPLQSSPSSAPSPASASPEQPLVTAAAWWLRLSDGSRLWLDSGGVLLGRNPDCDIRYDRPYIHRYHALIRQRAGRVELVPLGQNPCYIDGAVTGRPAVLEVGSRLTIEPGAWIQLERTPRPLTSKTRCTVQLDGQVHTLQTTTATVGGGSLDSLRHDGWPEAAVSLYILDEAVFCETSTAATIDGGSVLSRRAHRLSPGQAITINGSPLTLLSHQTVTPPTPRMVHSQPFQSAGRLLFRFDDRSQIRVCLPQSRYQLMHLLLEAYVGSRLRSATRTQGVSTLTDIDLPRGAAHARDLQIEVGGTRRLSFSALSDLFHQVRTDLIRAGINGERMLESGGSWARLHLGESCNITLYS